MKFIYEFSTIKEIEVEEKLVENIDGIEKITTKKSKKNQETKYGLRKPTRSMIDDGELFYAQQVSNYIKLGLIPQALLAKRLNNDEGIFSEDQKKEKNNFLLKYIEKLQLIQPLVEKLEKSEEEKKQLETLVADNAIIYQEIQSYDIAQRAQFNITAENHAQNKLILWWNLNLLYVEKDSVWHPVYGEGEYETKYKVFQAYEDQEETSYLSASKRAISLIYFWYTYPNLTATDFAAFDKEITK